MGAVLGAVAVAVVASVQGASLGATLDAVLGVFQWWFSRVVSSDDRYDRCHVCGQVLLDDSISWKKINTFPREFTCPQLRK